MLERDLKRIVCLVPELIEEGLVIENEEFPITSENTTYRCDLKGRDRNGKALFIELKLKAEDSVLYQIGKYKSFAEIEGRYMVAALEFKPDLPRVLQDHGYEYHVISREVAIDLLENHKDNPKLYKRRMTIRPNAKKNEQPRIIVSSLKLFDDITRETVQKLMEALEGNLNGYLKENFNVQYEALDIRKADQHRLIFSSPTGVDDKFIVYTRPREANIIELQFVPDFSFKTGYSTIRKEKFRDYIDQYKTEVSQLFGFNTVYSRTPDKVLHLGDHLLNTKQAWKALHYRIVTPLEEWSKPDFVEITTIKFLEFVELLLPKLKKLSFLNENQPYP